MFLDNNIKRYDVEENNKSVEGIIRGETEFSVCFSSALHVIAFLLLSRNISGTVLFL